MNLKQYNPDLLDIKLGEGADSRMLSGGESQLLNLARSFLKTGDVIILDEVISSLDQEKKEFIQKSVAGLNTKDKIVITISHSEKDFTLYDYIINLNQGGLHI